MSSADVSDLTPSYVSALPDTIKHLKTGDSFDFRPSNDTPIYITTLGRFTVLSADIIHHQHVNSFATKTASQPATLTLTTNYPFGRRLGDTPLRYVIYAALTHQT